jgi:hypothetical protein
MPSLSLECRPRGRGINYGNLPIFCSTVIVSNVLHYSEQTLTSTVN